MADDVLDFLLNLLPLAWVVLLLGVVACIGAGLWRLFWWIV